MCLRCLEGYEGQLSPGRTVLLSPSQLWGQSCVGAEAEQQSWGSGVSTGPFPADLNQGPCSVRGPERLGRGRGRIKLFDLI